MAHLRRVVDVKPLPPLLLDGLDEDSRYSPKGVGRNRHTTRRLLLWRGTVTLMSLVGVFGVFHHTINHNGGGVSAPAWTHPTRTTSTSTTTSTSSVRTGVRLDTNDIRKECTIYTAPSSLKGVTSMGIFTTRDIPKRQSILAAPDGPTVTILKGVSRGTRSAAAAATATREDSKSLFPNHQWLRLWGNYAWDRKRGVPEHVSYEAHQFMDFQITTGALPNHHCLLKSISKRFPAHGYDDTLVDHRRSPGTGAFSYNKGRDFFVNRDVTAGEELFLNYGYCSYEKKRPLWAKHIPMVSDYKKAADFVIKQMESGIDPIQKLHAPIHMEKSVAKLLPTQLSELKDVTWTTHQDLMMEIARHSGIEPRTPDWIRANGKCLEHLIPGTSQIPNAGHGAFSQHFIAKDDVIVPAPMIHIMEKHWLALFDDEGKRVGDQLLMNYCVGHPKSTLLMCPNTNANLINHCSARSSKQQQQQGCRSPNAEYRWSEGWDETSDRWKAMTLNEISEEPHRGLSMDVMALRDIQPGEEIFMDYGVRWEEAWEAHVASWVPPELIDMSVDEANDLYEPPPFLIATDIRSRKEHNYMFAGCQYRRSSSDKEVRWKSKDPNWERLGDEELLDRYGEDGSETQQQSYQYHADLSYWPCLIFKPESPHSTRFDSSGSPSSSYVVRILPHPHHEDELWSTNRLPRFLTNYPRTGMHFFALEGQGDHFLKGVFRHHADLPDSVFPDHWKNLIE